VDPSANAASGGGAGVKDEAEKVQQELGGEDGG
jgi:hypothetical protein